MVSPCLRNKLNDFRLFEPYVAAGYSAMTLLGLGIADKLNTHISWRVIISLSSLITCPLTFITVGRLTRPGGEKIAISSIGNNDALLTQENTKSCNDNNISPACRFEHYPGKSNIVYLVTISILNRMVSLLILLVDNHYLFISMQSIRRDQWAIIKYCGVVVLTCASHLIAKFMKACLYKNINISPNIRGSRLESIFMGYFYIMLFPQLLESVINLKDKPMWLSPLFSMFLSLCVNQVSNNQLNQADQASQNTSLSPGHETLPV